MDRVGRKALRIIDAEDGGNATWLKFEDYNVYRELLNDFDGGVVGHGPCYAVARCPDFEGAGANLIASNSGHELDRFTCSEF